MNTIQERDRPVIAFSTLVDITKNPGPERAIGRNVAIETPSPTSVNIFPQEITVTVGEGEEPRHKLPGTSSVRYGGEQLLIDTRGTDRKSRLLINADGKVVTIDNSDQATDNRLLASLIGGDIFKHPSDELIDYAELFANVNIMEPSSFEPLTFGQVIRFFREEVGWTQEQLAERSDLKTLAVTRLETGVTRTPKRISNLTSGFGWLGDPREEILLQALRRERDRMRKERSQTP